MSNIDRVKIEIPLGEIQELTLNAIKNIGYHGQENPMSYPVFSVIWGRKILRIDMSVPRLLFGNTLEEADETCFDSVIYKIQRQAMYKNISIPTASIENALPYYVEIGKNMPISTKHCSLAMLSRLGNCLAQRTNRVGKVKYYSDIGREGLKVSVWCPKREVYFYDKTAKELCHGGKHNMGNQEMFEWMLNEGWNVIRYEVKFENSDTVNRELMRFNTVPTFKNLWNARLVQAILLDYWDKLSVTLPPIRSRQAGLIKAIYTAIQNGATKEEIIFKLGFDLLEQKIGATTLKHLLVTPKSKLQGKSSLMTYSALRKKHNELNKKFTIKREYLAQKIGQYLTEFKPIRVYMLAQDIEGVL